MTAAYPVDVSLEVMSSPRWSSVRVKVDGYLYHVDQVRFLRVRDRSLVLMSCVIVFKCRDGLLDFYRTRFFRVRDVSLHPHRNTLRLVGGRKEESGLGPQLETKKESENPRGRG